MSDWSSALFGVEVRRSRSGFPGRLGFIRFLPLETVPGLVAFVQTPVGKIALVVAEAVVLSRRLHGVALVAVVLAATATAFAPRFRGRILFLGTAGMLCLFPGWFDFSAPRLVAALASPGVFQEARLRLIALLTFFALSALAIITSRRHPRIFISRRPVLSLTGFASALILLGASGVVRGNAGLFLWAFLATHVAYMWFLAYAIVDQRVVGSSSLDFELGTFHPFWGSTTVPYGKGAAYLKRVEAKTSRELAVVQLTGLKLLMWIVLLGYLWKPISAVATQTLHVPTMQEALASQAAGFPFPWHVCWASTIFQFLSDMVSVTLFGNTIVAVARFAGFRLLRNTYRPLSAKTIAEFFGRYYYYYKELLFEFFFFPTFVRYFKGRKRTRLLAATFAAAGAGNILFHFMRDSSYVAERGIFKAMIAFEPFVFYCVVLGLAIGLSQLRSHRRPQRHGWWRGQLVPSVTVIAFYCVMSIFNEIDSPFSMAQHFTFMFRLLGLDI